MSVQCVVASVVLLSQGVFWMQLSTLREYVNNSEAFGMTSYTLTMVFLIYIYIYVVFDTTAY
jgi:hypothetical protein